MIPHWARGCSGSDSAGWQRVVSTHGITASKWLKHVYLNGAYSQRRHREVGGGWMDGMGVRLAGRCKIPSPASHYTAVREVATRRQDQEEVQEEVHNIFALYDVRSSRVQQPTSRSTYTIRVSLFSRNTLCTCSSARLPMGFAYRAKMKHAARSNEAGQLCACSAVKAPPDRQRAGPDPTIRQP
jgi:hypothetical protein